MVIGVTHIVILSLLLSPCLFMSLTIDLAFAQSRIVSQSINYDTFSIYKNAQYGFEMQYPSNWQKVEFSHGIEQSGRNIVINFISPTEGNMDIFQEYLIIEIGNLQPQQKLIFSSPSSILSQYVDQQIGDYKKSFQGFQLIESSPSNKTDNNSILHGYSPSSKVVYTYDDLSAGKIKIMELYFLNKGKIYFMSFHSQLTSYMKYLPTIQKMIDSFHVT